MKRSTADVRSLAGRYWPDGGVDSDVFRARFPDERQLIDMARLTARGSVRFWHPWHMERTSVAEKIGRRIVWSAAPNGDREWPHALARCSHLVDLAAAHAITGASELLETWIDHVAQLAKSRHPSGFRRFVHPYERELWSNHLDAALRVVNLIRSYDLVRNAPEIPEHLHALAFEVMRDDTEALVEGLGRRVGNWEVFIPSAILLASMYLGRIIDTAEWKARAGARLEEILSREIGPDGIMAEQVPMYQGVCALALLDVLVAYRPNGLAPDPTMANAPVRMIEALAQLADPSGRIPTIGDSDAFEVGYLESFAKTVLGGTAVVASVPPAPPAVSLAVMRSVGWAVARWRSTEGEPGYLLFDASGRPPATHAGHSHADDLQIVVHTGSGPLLVDPGRFTYAAGFQPHLPFVGRALSPRGRFGALNRLLLPQLKELNERDWRAYFRSTLAHNTVTLAGRNQPGYDSPLEVPSRVQLSVARMDGDIFSLVASAEGSGPTRFRHERIVVGVVPEMLVIMDRVESDDRTDWTASYHGGIDVDARLVEPGTVELSRSGRDTRTFTFAAVGDGSLQVVVEDDWVSPIYNEKRKTRTIRATVRRASRTYLISVLTLEPSPPGAPSGKGRPQIEQLPANADGASGARVVLGDAGGRVEVAVDPAGRRRVVVRRSSPAGEAVTEIASTPEA